MARIEPVLPTSLVNPDPQRSFSQNPKKKRERTKEDFAAIYEASDGREYDIDDSGVIKVKEKVDIGG